MRGNVHDRVDVPRELPKNVVMLRSLAFLSAALGVAACSSSAPPSSTDGQPDARDASAADRFVRDRTAQDAPLPRPDGGSTLGQPCTADHECSTGLYCERTLLGGMCTRPCTADSACGGAMAACHQGRCHLRCNPRSIFSPCRADYVCRISGASAVCVPSCKSQPCAKGWVCDANTGLCVDSGGGKLGDLCGATEGTCDGTPNGTCVKVSSFKPGFCTVPCAPFTKPCPDSISGSQCLLGTATAPYCAFLCDPKQPKCPGSSLSCQSLGGGAHVCLPK